MRRGEYKKCNQQFGTYDLKLEYDNLAKKMKITNIDNNFMVEGGNFSSNNLL